MAVDPYTVIKVVTLILGAASAKQQIDQGKAEEDAAKYQAAELRKQANDRYAAATRDAAEKRRQAAIVLSNARAVQSASGGSTTDPQALEQQAGIQQIGEYNSLASLYEGQSEYDALKSQSLARAYEGKQAKKRSRSNAIVTLASAALSAYSVGKVPTKKVTKVTPAKGSFSSFIE